LSTFWCGFLAPLDNQQIASFDLGHHTREDRVNERVEARVTGEVMCNMNLKAFVG
jgi:hypothetical protein